MLVLTRRQSEEILLFEVGKEGDPTSEHYIKITVLKATDGRVKIGIEAPEGIEILRSELLQERDNANRNGNTTTDVPGCVS